MTSVPLRLTACQELAGGDGLRRPLLGKPHVGPAGEAVLPVPDTLAVTQQHQLLHGISPLCLVLCGASIPQPAVIASLGEVGAALQLTMV